MGLDDWQQGSRTVERTVKQVPLRVVIHRLDSWSSYVSCSPDNFKRAYAVMEWLQASVGLAVVLSIIEDFVLVEQYGTIWGSYNTPYSPSDKRSQGERMNNFHAEPWYISFWAGFITFIMGFSREDLLW